MGQKVIPREEADLNTKYSVRRMLPNNKWCGHKINARRNDLIRTPFGPTIACRLSESQKLSEITHRCRLRTRRIRLRKKFPRAPCAPLNTTSFIMQSKTRGLSLYASPATPTTPATQAVIPTHSVSPAPRFREGLVEVLRREWGLDGYGSMKDLIRVRPLRLAEGDEVRCRSESRSEIDYETHDGSLRRSELGIDDCLNRFEMISSPFSVGVRQQRMAFRVQELENLAALLEDENRSLKNDVHCYRREIEELERKLHLRHGAQNDGSDESGGAWSERGNVSFSSCHLN